MVQLKGMGVMKNHNRNLDLLCRCMSELELSVE